MNTLAAWLVLVFYLAFAFPPWQTALTYLYKRFGDCTVGLLLLPYMLAVNLQPVRGDLLRFVIFLALPTICLRLRPKDAKPFDLFHVLAILTIWIPVETDLFLLMLDVVVPKVDLSTQLSSFYLLPVVEAILVPGMVLPIHSLTFVPLALFLFFVHHPLEGIGFTFRLGMRDLMYAMIGLLAFIAVGFIVGLGIGFLHFNPVALGALDLIVGIVGSYVLVALIEEVLFRGIIQNLLAKRLGNERLALLIASVIFGLSHLNNAKAGFAAPNWAYALMATLAGLAYGWVWVRTRKVTVSAVTHMSVNLVWGVVFH